MSGPSNPSTPPSPHAAIAERIIGNIAQASSPSVSPDGRHVAFVVARVDMEHNKYFSQVWVAATDGGTPPRPITGGENDGAPTWSPDGSCLAFTSRRSLKKGEATLHVLPFAATGETRTVASMKDGVGDAAFSPDGRWIGFISRTPHERYGVPGAEEGDTSWQSPRKIERFFTQLNGEGWVYDRPAHVYVVPADGTAAPRNLTPGEFQHGGVSWTADSTAIVTSAQRHDTWDLDFASDLYLVPLQGEITPLTDHTGITGSASAAPSGSLVALLGHPDSQTYPQNVHVAVLDREAGDGPRWLSRALDRTFETTAGTVTPVWLDDANLLTSAEDRGATHLYRVPTDGSGPVRLTEGAISVKGAHAAGGTVAYVASSVDAVADVFVLAADGPRRLTSFADTYRTTASPLTWERFAVPCTDGSGELDAWIMRPAGFDPAVTYPVMLNVHGGPHTQYGESFFDEAQMQAAAGFVVLMSNPRGGSGREQQWGQAIMGPKHPAAPGSGWGGVDVDDVMAVLDSTLERYPFCDRQRVGMIGGSYGGYMATMLAGRFSDRFKGICSERAVNNVLTEEFNSDIATVFRVEHGPRHIDDPAEYERLSPIRHVRDITCPMLIIHSEDDLRCPINQAEELFVALRLLGKDVTFYRFPGESHELSRSGSPVHRRQRAEIILDWFTTKLG
ncbi:MAG: S9 family peptidase [Actinomycetota bacterium]|nr:S9 family peptidase [Actinomycetota bacterium]